MNRWYWVRHGPTHERAMTGHRDVPADLSDRAALDRLDAALPRDALLVSSDLLRAVATADALAAGRTRLPHEPALREFDFGDWDGLTFDAVAARDPDLSRRFWDEPGTPAPPGGESWDAVAARVGAAADRLAAAHPGRTIVAVAHIGVIMTAIHRATGGPALAALAHEIAPLSVTEIRSDPPSVLRINHRP